MSTNSTLDHASQLRVVLTLIFLGFSVLLIGGAITLLREPAYFFLCCFIVIAVVVFINHRNDIWLLTFLLPFYSTQQVPHQLFGMTGLNPLNCLFVLTLLSLFAASAFRREDIKFVSFPTTFCIYVGVITLGANVGAGSVEREIALPDSEPLTKTAYLLNFVKSLIMLAVAWLATVLSRNGNGRTVIWAVAAAYVTFFFVIAGYLVSNGVSLQSLASRDALRRLDCR
jgi:hypothetical protein